MNIGENLKKYRNEKKISQRKLAQAAGVSFAYIQQLEKNEKQNPGIEIIKRLSAALEIEIHDLIGSIPGKDTFVSDTGKITTVIPKNNGPISIDEYRDAIIKVIGHRGNLQDYVIGGEYGEIIDFLETCIDGKILLLKSKRGNKI
jgi:transcriptional regulator with XRE-family HTH domain